MMATSQAKLSQIPRRFKLFLIDRYVLGEIILPFCFGMGLFSSLGIAVGTLFDLVRQVSESQVMFSIALQVLLLKMPEFIAYAIPMSVLLATLMAYSRLSNDSELIALRSVGVSLYRLIIPGIIFSVAIAGCTFLFQESVVPAANYQSNLVLARAINQQNIFSANQNNLLYPQYQQVLQPDGQKQKMLTRIFYAEEFDGKLMQELTVIDFSRSGIGQIITSRSAALNLKENTWDFFDGYTYAIEPDGSYGNVVRFERQKLQIPRDSLNLGNRVRQYNEMNLAYARSYLKTLTDDRQIREIQVRIQEKIAFPFICIVLGLVGAAIGTSANHGGKAINFGICVLIIFGYYLLAFTTSALGIAGILPPLVSAWIPNCFVAIAGALILVKVAS